MKEINPIVLGHNQFIGVDHTSQDRGKARAEKFSFMDKIIDIIEFAYKMNVNGLMISTHPRTKQIMNEIKNYPELARNMTFYPLIPYAQGYVKKMNEKGILGLVNDILSQANLNEKINIIYKGGMGILKKDIEFLLEIAIDVELLSFKDFNVGAVFLHNVLTDLALSIGSKEVFEIFINHIKKKHNTIPAFCTLNFAKLLTNFNEWGFSKPLIMAPFNKIGYQMNPSREKCEEVLKEYDVDIIAMATLAAGHIKPEEAYEYLFTLPNIKSVVVGTSNKAHAKETFEIITYHQTKQ